MKHHLLRLLMTGALVSCALSGSGLCAGWFQYRGAKVDGVSGERIQSTFPAGAPKCVWRAPTPAGFSSFAIDDGKAFTLVTREIDGTRTEACLALDAKSGKELWAVGVGAAKYPGGGESGTSDNQGGDGPRSTPAAGGGRVYVYSSEMVLRCLDANSGKSLWAKDLIKEFGGQNLQWKSAMSPVLDGGLVFVAGGGPGQSMIAFNQTGAVAWKVGDDKPTYATPTLATLQGTRQVIFLMQSGLVALEAATGKALWKFAFPYRTATACSPVVAGDVVFCTAGYEVGGAACRVSKTGADFEPKEIWRVKGNEPLASLWSTPVQKDGCLYGMISFKKFGRGPLKCVDLSDGKVKWEQAGFGAGQVLLAGNCLVALSDTGEVVIAEASPDHYQELGRFKAVSGKCWSSPGLNQGRLYVRSTKEGACFDLSATN
ncbi:Pyrrolo-quinoline quinone [Verrucomicrobia bacterium]|nr:Pyrrolo-quinoline quinone [Verrucomicrobiota bacterium]